MSVSALDREEVGTGPDLRRQVTLPAPYNEIKGDIPEDASRIQEPLTEPVGGSDAWRAIAGFPGYEATVSGQVRRAKTGKVLKQRTAKGQLFVTLTPAGGGSQKTVYIKQAILLAYQPAFAACYEAGQTIVLHGDGHTNNFALMNLRWWSSDERLWGTNLNGEAAFLYQLDAVGRRRVFGYCSRGHALSTTGDGSDSNTKLWGYGQRICVTCEARTNYGRWLEAPSPGYSYGCYGTAVEPPQHLLSSVVRDRGPAAHAPGFSWKG